MAHLQSGAHQWTKKSDLENVELNIFLKNDTTLLKDGNFHANEFDPDGPGLE